MDGYPQCKICIVCPLVCRSMSICLSVCLTAIVVPFAKVISLRLGLISDLASTFQSWKNIPFLGGFPHLFTLGVLIIAGIKLSPELILSESGLLLIILMGVFLIFINMFFL